jgi:HD-GYP domain-containing protein (c-di-GMP phosphodiesterase class II)
MSRLEDGGSARATTLAGILAPLSCALDLTVGQPQGHAQGSCLIAMRLADALGVSADDQASLYFAVLLKDAGSSANASRMHEVYGGDEIEAKRMATAAPLDRGLSSIIRAGARSEPNAPLLVRMSRFATLSRHERRSGHELTRIKCQRGSEIAAAIGLSNTSAECILTLERHWQRQGASSQERADQIPLLARITAVAQHFDAHLRASGLESAAHATQILANRQFDPGIVAALSDFLKDDAFWNDVLNRPEQAILAIDGPAAQWKADDDAIERVCAAFAQIVDMKSRYTDGHSFRVSSYAEAMGRRLGLAPSEMSDLRRAGLLHDIGRLSLPNSILDIQGRPTPEAWQSIRRASELSEQIIGRVPGFGKIAEIVSAQHERLDGTGYHKGISAARLTVPMRILAVANTFDALTVDRAQRPAISMVDALPILDREAGVGLDKACVDAIKAEIAESAAMRLHAA